MQVMYEYELPRNTSSFVYSSSFFRYENSKNGRQKVDANNYVIIMLHVGLM